MHCIFKYLSCEHKELSCSSPANLPCHPAPSYWGSSHFTKLLSRGESSQGPQAALVAWHIVHLCINSFYCHGVGSMTCLRTRTRSHILRRGRALVTTICSRDDWAYASWEPWAMKSSLTSSEKVRQVYLFHLREWRRTRWIFQVSCCPSTFPGGFCSFFKLGSYITLEFQFTSNILEWNILLLLFWSILLP